MATDCAQLVGAPALEEGARSQVVRAFFGLPVPEGQRAAVADFLAACAEAAPQFRWTPAANLHLTVRFIGNIDRALVEAIADRLGARSSRAFDLELADLGTFGHGRHVRVVWRGLRDGAEAVAALAAQVEAECAAAGLVAEKRPFQPHLTLARARPREGAVLPPLPRPPRSRGRPASDPGVYATPRSPTASPDRPL